MKQSIEEKPFVLFVFTITEAMFCWDLYFCSSFSRAKDFQELLNR